jgi:hypothetical protein
MFNSELGEPNSEPRLNAKSEPDPKNKQFLDPQHCQLFTAIISRSCCVYHMLASVATTSATVGAAAATFAYCTAG